MPLSRLVAMALLVVLFPHLAPAQPTPEAPPLLVAMEGTWAVTQRSWDGPDAEPTELPPAVATREVVAGGGFLQEVMTLAEGADDGAAGALFTRTALLNLDATSGRFGYVSLDSRAPQQMVYQSPPVGPDEADPLALQGGSFVAPAWGDARNVPFAYRLEVGPVEGDQQVVRLYLTPQGEGAGPEFLAMEYIYTRQP